MGGDLLGQGALSSARAALAASENPEVWRRGAERERLSRSTARMIS
jgi:hypothetical protein